MRRFIVLARRNQLLREETEAKLGLAMQAFALARAMMSNAEMEEALLYPARSMKIQKRSGSVLSVAVPKLEMETQEGFVYPYGFVTTGADLDAAVQQLSEVLPLLVELAEVEKSCTRLADEIEKTRRRVNALEYVMIPQFDEAIRAIQMKLDENERSSQTRLMKTKEMLAAQQEA